MFRLPTPRLLSGLKSALRPAMPRFKVSAFWLLILAWIFLLVWIWWKGPMWTLYEEQWLKPLANRWLATAAWGIIALVWLTVRVMKRLQQLEKMQKQQREEAVDPLSVELNAQQRYLDRWLLRLQPSRQPPFPVAVAVVYGHRPGGQWQNDTAARGVSVRHYLCPGGRTRRRTTPVPHAPCR